MKKLLLSAVGMMMVVVMASGCSIGKKAAQPPRFVAGTAASRAAMGDVNQNTGGEDEPFFRLMRMLEDTAADVSMETPKTRRNLAIQANPVISTRQSVANVLQYAAYSVQLPPERMPELPADALVLSAQKPDGSPFSAWISTNLLSSGGAGLLICENNTPIGLYAYNENLYGNVLSLIETCYSDQRVQLDGNYAILRSKYDLQQILNERNLTLGNFLQMKDGLLWSFTVGETPENTVSIVEMLGYATKKSTYTSSIPERILRLERSDRESGYDYRIFTSSGLRYRDSTSPSKEKLYRLPQDVKLMTLSEQVGGTFDFFEDKVAYAAADGIYVSKTDGSQKTLVASHSALKSVMDPNGDVGYNYFFNDPRFMMDGQRLVLSVMAPAADKRQLAFATVRLDTLEIRYHTGMTSADANCTNYLEDKLITTRDGATAYILNVDTGDQASMPLGATPTGSLLFSADGKTFVTSEPAILDDSNRPTIHTYVTDAAAEGTERELLLWAKGERFTPHTVTENYFIGFVQDSRGLLPVAAFYLNSQNAKDALEESKFAPESETEEDAPANEDITVTPEVDLTDIDSSSASSEDSSSDTSSESSDSSSSDTSSESSSSDSSSSDNSSSSSSSDNSSSSSNSSTSSSQNGQWIWPKYINDEGLEVTASEPVFIPFGSSGSKPDNVFVDENGILNSGSSTPSSSGRAHGTASGTPPPMPFPPGFDPYNFGSSSSSSSSDYRYSAKLNAALSNLQAIQDMNSLMDSRNSSSGAFGLNTNQWFRGLFGEDMPSQTSSDAFSTGEWLYNILK